MARQPRLVLAGQPHLLLQHGHNGQPIVRDAVDTRRWVDLLRDVAAARRVALHAWRLDQAEFRLLATPSQPTDLSRLLQDLGRRYVNPFNARHGRSGTLWDGRFRCSAVQAGAWELVALAFVEELLPGEPALSSREHHLGHRHDAWLADPAGYWALGNTPFERHAAWLERLDQGLEPQRIASVTRALRSGLPLGDEAWLRQLQQATQRELFARPRGRPRKASPLTR